MSIKRFLHWLRSHRTLTRYVTVRLLVGLAICIVCLRLFAELVEEVFTKQQFGRLDLALANALHAVATPGATSFFLLVTTLGFQVLWIVAVAVGVYFLWKRRWLRLIVWIVALAGGELLDALLKLWFARPRPAFADPLAVALFYSFPSGHAMLSLITYGLLGYFLFLDAAARLAARPGQRRADPADSANRLQPPVPGRALPQRHPRRVRRRRAVAQLLHHRHEFRAGSAGAARRNLITSFTFTCNFDNTSPV